MRTRAAKAGEWYLKLDRNSHLIVEQARKRIEMKLTFGQNLGLVTLEDQTHRVENLSMASGKPISFSDAAKKLSGDTEICIPPELGEDWKWLT